ncbi:MAG: ABC transporter permease [Ruminococcaceae bacterium]|nr:ABC transporter permease [Oscillospiraceae bacterium]
MRMMTFAERNLKEIVRDPLNLSFLFGFPVVLLLLLSAIQANIPVSLFEIESLAPGIVVFGLAFMTLFSATLISKDRQTSFMHRLYTTPMTSGDFILGYTLPLIPIAMAEGVVCYIFAAILGLEININIILSIIFIIPVALMYIGIGLLCGSVFNDKQVGGICGALLTNLSAWLSGIWFDLDLVGGLFKRIAYMLPFVHAVEMERAVAAGNYSEILPHLLWVLGYGITFTVIAVFLFLRQMKKQ